jgi:hypothetical protein
MTPSINASLPQTTFAFDVRALSHPGVQRTIELRGDQTLADLHGVIEEEFALDDEHLWAFYLSGEWYDRHSEFGRSGRAHEVELRSLGLEPGLQIAHLHDFGEEWRHVVDVARVGTEEPGAEYPRVTARVGQVESRWDPEDEEELEGEPFAPGLLAEIQRAMKARGGEDRAARDRALPASAAAVEAALDACPTNRRLEQLGRSLEGPFPWFVDDVLQGLAAAGSTPQAVALMTRIAKVLEFEPFTVEELTDAIEVATAWDDLDYQAEIDLPATKLAERVHALCAALPTPSRASELSSLVGYSVPSFLSRAVDQLAAAGRFDAAREAAVWLSHAGRNPGELVTVADHLTRADRKDEARRLLAEAAALPYALSA